MDTLNLAQNMLFERYAPKNDDKAQVPLVFILGSPRTGSTLAYQVLINFFGFNYFSNFVVDHFAETPIVGTALEKLLNPRKPVSYESTYGKTSGPWEPSEASPIFKNWFGGGHPSQIVSATVHPEKEAHLVLTMQCVHGLTGKPLLVKNAWNCFRIADLTRIFPRAHFIWVRRDIARSALSDLVARYKRGGPGLWNSATTANYLEIQKLPYWEQVVEQQYEYNIILHKDLHDYANGRFYEIWYEDLFRDIRAQLSSLANFFDSISAGIEMADLPVPALNNSSLNTYSQFPEDWHKIEEYVGNQIARLSPFTH